MEYTIILIFSPKHIRYHIIIITCNIYHTSTICFATGYIMEFKFDIVTNIRLNCHNRTSLFHFDHNVFTMRYFQETRNDFALDDYGTITKVCKRYFDQSLYRPMMRFHILYTFILVIVAATVVVAAAGLIGYIIFSILRIGLWNQFRIRWYDRLQVCQVLSQHNRSRSANICYTQDTFSCLHTISGNSYNGQRILMIVVVIVIEYIGYFLYDALFTIFIRI
mmetsp:Transcript_12845/g.24112  ORF Transcript_12845/g.24112 Transcript_12845/m.24112 type:complete len:221 (+) Transcript_12845:2316-2978(+)